jgi:hypothetical protein
MVEPFRSSGPARVIDESGSALALNVLWRWLKSANYATDDMPGPAV